MWEENCRSMKNTWRSKHKHKRARLPPATETQAIRDWINGETIYLTKNAAEFHTDLLDAASALNLRFGQCQREAHCQLEANQRRTLSRLLRRRGGRWRATPGNFPTSPSLERCGSRLRGEDWYESNGPKVTRLHKGWGGDTFAAAADAAAASGGTAWRQNMSLSMRVWVRSGPEDACWLFVSLQVSATNCCNLFTDACRALNNWTLHSVCHAAPTATIDVVSAHEDEITFKLTSRHCCHLIGRVTRQTVACDRDNKPFNHARNFIFRGQCVVYSRSPWPPLVRRSAPQQSADY